MCELNKDLHFHTGDFDLVLNLSTSGSVSGAFLPLTVYGAKKEYPCKGCYFVQEADVINLAFMTEWSPSTETTCDFTCFSGQIIKQNILMLDWILINQKDGNNYAVNGNALLYLSSSQQEEKKENVTEGVMPFPINVKLVEN